MKSPRSNRHVAPRRSLTRRCAWLVLLALAFAPRLANAAEPSTDPTIVQARELHQKGAELLAKGELEAARAALAAAYAIHPHHATAAVLGTCEVKLQRYRDAAEHLEQYLREAPADTDASERQAGEELFATAKEHVGEVRISVSHALGDGAHVLVNGRAVGDSPLGKPIFVEAGALVITAEKAGVGRGEARLTVGAGEASAADVELGAGSSSGHPVWALSVTGFAVGGAALVTAIGLHGAANAQSSDNADRRAELLGAGAFCTPVTGGFEASCQELADGAGRKDAFSNAALGSYIGAGTVLAASAIYTLAAAASAPSSSLALVPVPSPAGATAFILGNF
ncbi:MAG: hypothetical protein HY908_03360 [Myxococcales bacterium]|nr:hypothetical protein [Myxococcales bacterium]